MNLLGLGKAGVAIEVLSSSGEGSYVDELGPHLVGRDGLQLGQLLLIAHGSHQGETVPIGEEGLDRLPNLHLIAWISASYRLQGCTSASRAQDKECQGIQDTTVVLTLFLACTAAP